MNTSPGPAAVLRPGRASSGMKAGPGLFFYRAGARSLKKRLDLAGVKAELLSDPVSLDLAVPHKAPESRPRDIQPPGDLKGAYKPLFAHRGGVILPQADPIKKPLDKKETKE